MHRLYLKEERQRLESQMARMGADLSQMQERVMQTEQLASIGELVSGVAHELNNPLTSVIGYSQLLLSSDVPEHIKPDLEIVDSEAQRCQRIVQNLLGLARQDTVEISATDINDLIQRTLELKAYLLRVDNITVDLDLASDLAFVWANPCQVQQVLLNLVGNAHEAMAHASSSGTLSITSRYLGDEHSRPMVRVTISDDGPGVPPENRERIFESFFSTKRDQQGTGLGLSISRRIVREFGGELWLDDGPPVGACFVIDLPAHNSVARHQERDQETISRAKEGAARLLIVDDEADIANLLERLLGNTGYIVSTASDGYEAERLLYIGQYDLILLDFKMPGIDGPTIYDTARLTQSRETQIIFMTGDLANAKTAGWLEKVGCPVIEKPFDIKRVIRVVTQTLDAPH